MCRLLRILMHVLVWCFSTSFIYQRGRRISVGKGREFPERKAYVAICTSCTFRVYVYQTHGSRNAWMERMESRLLLRMPVCMHAEAKQRQSAFPDCVLLLHTYIHTHTLLYRICMSVNHIYVTVCTIAVPYSYEAAIQYVCRVCRCRKAAKPQSQEYILAMAADFNRLQSYRFPLRAPGFDMRFLTPL